MNGKLVKKVKLEEKWIENLNKKNSKLKEELENILSILILKIYMN